MKDSQPFQLSEHNQNSLKALIRMITYASDQFSCILVECNYQQLKHSILKQLQEQCPIEIQHIQLDSSMISLPTAIRQKLRSELPQALIISGLQQVESLHQVLNKTDQEREEFYQFPFPIIFWVNSQILQTFMRSAHGLYSWVRTINFVASPDELIALIQQTDEHIYNTLIEAGAGVFLENEDLDLERGNSCCDELRLAHQDLQSQGIKLEPELEARLEFILGRGTDNSTLESQHHYQRSLELWQQVNNPVRYAHVLYYLGLWWRSFAVRNRANKEQAYAEAETYFCQAIQTFEEVNRADLAANFINAWLEILHKLADWTQLETVSNRAIELHQKYSDQSRLARAFGFLAEVKLAQSDHAEARKLALQALKFLKLHLSVTSKSRTVESEKSLDWESCYHQGWYLFSLAKSQQNLGQSQKSIQTLKRAKNRTKPEYDPELYISILQKLREVYWDNKAYLEAFETKQIQRQIEQQFGFRAFIGAGRLRANQLNLNPAFPQFQKQKTSSLEISTSGRQKDLDHLIERMERSDHKLTVICGASGVGKSSILQAGFIPTLQQKRIDTRQVIPTLQRIYINWIQVLGEKLKSQLKLNYNLHTVEEILEQLRSQVNQKLMTVFIFDQFEEFFFACKHPQQKREFYQFLKDCLNIPYVKVVLALREDYLYYLVECNRLEYLEIINHNILDKNILYYLGYLTPEDTRAVIYSLTQQAQFILEPQLIDRLVEDLAGELQEVRPIELQVVGAQLQAKNINTLKQYQQLGENPKAELVKDYLTEVIQDCGSENQKAAQLLLYLLTDENNTRPLKTQSELEKDLNALSENLGTDQQSIDLILEIFVKSGLVLLLKENPASRYQLVHDYLVRFIRQQNEVKLHQELEQEREQRKRSEAKLNRVLKQQLRQTRMIGMGMTAIALISVVIATLNKTQTLVADHNTSSNALLEADLGFEALLDSLRASRVLKNWWGQWVSPKTQFETLRLLQTAISQTREQNRLQGHEKTVLAVSYSPDGQIIASASVDNTIKLWTVEGKLIRTIKGHQDKVWDVQFSPDGEILASASADGTVKLWTLEGELLRTISAHNKPVYSIRFSPDGEILASASDDNMVKLWTREGELIQTLAGHQAPVHRAVFSPDGKMLISASDDKTVRLWTREGEEIKTLKGHRDWVLNVAISPDGETIASVGRDQTIRLWNRQGKPLKTIPAHNYYIWGVNFSSDGQTLVTSSSDNTIKLWTIDGENLQTLKGHNGRIYSVSFSPDAEFLASASTDNTIKLWSLEPKQLNTIRHSDPVRSVSFHPNGQTLVTATHGGIVLLWSREGETLRILEKHNQAVTQVRFSPDGELIASASRDGTLKLWNSSNGERLHTLQHKAQVNDINDISFSSDSQIIASASQDKTIKLWSRNGELLQTLEGHKDGVLSVSIHPDNQTIASGSKKEDSIKLWSLNPSQELKIFSENSKGIHEVSFSPDGKFLASASSEQTIKLWNPDSGKLLKTLDKHNGSVYGVNFSPNNQMLASASRDKTIKLWTRRGKLIATLWGHQDSVYDVSFSSDGKLLASASWDKTVRLWNLDLDELRANACYQVKDYLRNNSKVSASDRNLCQGVDTSIPEGESLARQGKIEEAIAKFQRALKKDPSHKFDPEIKAKRIAASSLIKKGENLARLGKVEQAKIQFQQALDYLD
ncbi:MAG: hypothetical protein AAFO04_27975 [Cyanobacteria bacterium J06592_8]